MTPSPAPLPPSAADGRPEPDAVNLIQFKPRDPDAFPVQRKPVDYAGCRHAYVAIDTELRQVECDVCGAVLDPLATLLRFSDEINRHWQQIQEYEARVQRQSDQRRARRAGGGA